MKRWIVALMATTSLTAVALAPAAAAVVSEIPLGGFGGSFAGRTVLAAQDLTIAGDKKNYSNREYTTADDPGDWFETTAGSFNVFRLVFTAGRVGYQTTPDSSTTLSPYGIDNLFGYSGSGSSSSPGPIGGLVFTPLTKFNSAATVSGTDTPLALVATPATGTSYTVADSGLNPMLAFYDAAGGLLRTVTVTDGNSVTLDGTIAPASSLYFKISSPFDYMVEVSTSLVSNETNNVPEPASAAALAAALAALAIRRRRR